MAWFFMWGQARAAIAIPLQGMVAMGAAIWACMEGNGETLARRAEAICVEDCAIEGAGAGLGMWGSGWGAGGAAEFAG